MFVYSSMISSKKNWFSSEKNCCYSFLSSSKKNFVLDSTFRTGWLSVIRSFSGLPFQVYHMVNRKPLHNSYHTMQTLTFKEHLKKLTVKRLLKSLLMIGCEQMHWIFMLFVIESNLIKWTVGRVSYLIQWVYNMISSIKGSNDKVNA